MRTKPANTVRSPLRATFVPEQKIFQKTRPPMRMNNVPKYCQWFREGQKRMWKRVQQKRNHQRRRGKREGKKIKMKGEKIRKNAHAKTKKESRS
tara:strand:- start:96 stop:377 length:282 start_codon:yes stop_codon:yes gene_type:complete